MARVYQSLLFLMTLHIKWVLGSMSHRCDFGEYWHRVLDTCRPCSDVCEPLTRPPCQELCNAYFLSIVLPSATYKLTSTTQANNHTQPIPYSDADEKNLQLILAVCMPLVVVIMLIVIIALCIKYGKKDKNTRPKASDTVPRRRETVLDIAGANIGRDGTRPLLGQFDAGQPNGQNIRPKQSGNTTRKGAMANDERFMPLMTTQTVPTHDLQNTSGNDGPASIDNEEKMNWSTTAVYDEKNKCMKLINMDRFPRETNV